MSSVRGLLGCLRRDKRRWFDAPNRAWSIARLARSTNLPHACDLPSEVRRAPKRLVSA